MSERQPSDRPSGPGRFETTRWTWVCAAQDPGEPARTAAFESLCATYWYPLYAYVRRRGYPPSEAEDLTQEFFRRLIEKDYLKAADQEKGRFRTFLLVAVKRFLANEWHRARAQKRGGGQVLFSFDASRADAMYQAEPVDPETPESLYERRWALLVLEQALDGVRREMEVAGKGRMYEALKHTLTGIPANRSYAEIGAQLGLREGAVKTKVHRLRERFRNHIRATIADTVETEAEIDQEINHLFAVFAR